MHKNKFSKRKYNELVKASVDAIMEYNILFLPDVAAYLPITRTQFYDAELDLAPEIQEAVEKQRSLAKCALTEKWLKSDSPTLNIALYKLISTHEERLALAGKAGDDEDCTKTQRAYLESLELMGEENESD